MVDASPVSGDDLKRAEEFARESFVLEGEDAATALAENGARRAALDAALKELDAGRTEPSVEWRREFSLMLGLERLLAEDEPHLVDGTVLSAHQVDALSGTLEGVPAVLGYLMGENHLDDYRLDVVDILASDERVAIVGRASGRVGTRPLTNDFVQVIRLEDGRVAEVWNYAWDQRAIAELFPAAA